MPGRIALVLFVALALLSVSTDAIVFKVALSNRPKMNLVFTDLPDHGWTGYPQFLENVRAHTQPGDSIALVVPSMRWDDGYSYAYYRASYFLTGREVLPLVRRDDAAVPQNFGRATYVAAWHRNVKDATRHVVWSGDGGVLLGH